MPIDPSISLGYKAPVLRDPLEQYNNVLALQNAQRQNQLGEMQYRNALRSEQEAKVLNDAYRNAFNPQTGEVDQTAVLNALAGGGAGRAIPGAQKGFAEALQAKLGLTKTQLENLAAQTKAYSTGMAALSRDPSPENVSRFAEAMQKNGIPLHAPIPSVMDQGALTKWLQSGAAQTKEGMDILGQFAPKPTVAGGDIVDFQPLSPTYMKPVGQVSPRIPEGMVRGPDGKLVFDQGYLKGKTQLAAASAPRVNVDNRAETTYAQTVGKGAAERDQEQFSLAQGLPENVAKIDSLIKHLNTSDAITGLGADVLKNVERVRTLLQVSEKAGKRVADTELLDAMLGSDVFPMIGALGIGARGLDTPAEREFLRKVMTGTVDMNKDTLLRMAEIRRDVSERMAERFNKRIESGELDRYFQYSGVPKKKLELPKSQKSTSLTPAEQAEYDALKKRFGDVGKPK